VIDFEGEFEKRISEEVTRRGTQLVEGAAADFADYKGRAAEIRGLNRALEIAKEIRRDMNKE